jgi:hypothetical protein
LDPGLLLTIGDHHQPGDSSLVGFDQGAGCNLDGDIEGSMQRHNAVRVEAEGSRGGRGDQEGGREGVAKLLLLGRVVDESLRAVAAFPIEQGVGQLVGNDEPGPMSPYLLPKRIISGDPCGWKRRINFDSVAAILERSEEALRASGPASEVGNYQLDA